MPSSSARKFGVLIIIVVVGVLLLSLTAILTISQAGIHGFVYRSLRDVQDLTSAIEPPPLYLVESMLVAHELVEDGESGPRIARLRELQTAFLDHERQWLERIGNPETHQALEELGRPAHLLIDISDNGFLPALERHDIAAARALLHGPMAEHFQAHRQRVIDLLTRLHRLHHDEEDRARSLIDLGAVCMVAVLACLLAAGWGLMRIRRSHLTEIRDRENRMLLLAQATFEGIALTDGVRIIDANRQLAQLLAVAGELKGRSLLDFIAERDRPRFLAQLADRSEADDELTIMRADGTPIAVELRTRFHAVDGDAVRLLALRDITAAKQAQDELITFRNQLQQLVAERTAELDQARRAAEAASAEAAAANRAKSAFLANMSHEIRTPLNAVLGYAQQLKRDRGLDQHARNAVEVISRSGEHLLTLISDILDMARIESGRIQCDLASCDLHSLLAEMRSLFLLRARDKGLELQLAIAPAVPQLVLTDARKVRQILANLIANAVKFTQRGRIAVAADYSKERLRVEIADSGIGMSADELAVLFQPFVQVKSSRTRGDGTGLWLSISRALTELLGGELTAISNPGAGSTFAMTIPAPACAPPVGGRPRSSLQLRVDPARPLLRVLIAEDHADSRSLLCDLMRGIGADVQEAADGAQAVGCAAAWRPDLVWMDLDMPVMDGLAAATAVRAADPTASTVIIALTAAAFAEDRERILAAGCTEVCHKPFDEAELFACMERLLPGRFLRGSPDAGAAGATAQLSDERLRSCVAALPPAQRDQLHQALLIGDLAAVVTASAEWPDRAAAAAIAALAETLNLDRLMAVFGAGSDGSRAGGT